MFALRSLFMRLPRCRFDAMWSSSLTASAVKGLPDIETVDTTARLGVIKDTLAVPAASLISRYLLLQL